MLFCQTGAAVNPFLANMVAYWRFNSDSLDSTINSHNGTDTAINYSNAGLVNNCATFDGTSSKIIVPQSTDFDFSDISSDIPFTMGFFAKHNSSGSTQWIMSKRNGSVAQYDILFAGGFLYIYLYTNTSNYLFARTNDTIVNGAWNYFTITYTGSGVNTGIKIYTSGLVGSGTSISSVGTYTKMPIASQPVVIGVENFTDSFFFGLNGALDEVAIWKGVAYTQAQSLDAYNKLLTGNSLI